LQNRGISDFFRFVVDCFFLGAQDPYLTINIIYTGECVEWFNWPNVEYPDIFNYFVTSVSSYTKQQLKLTQDYHNMLIAKKTLKVSRNLKQKSIWCSPRSKWYSRLPQYADRQEDLESQHRNLKQKSGAFVAVGNQGK
jgi:hypothetical protein